LKHKQTQNSKFSTVLTLRRSIQHDIPRRITEPPIITKGNVFMTTKLEREISRNIPRDIPITFSETTVPLLTAYGCVLMERDTGKSYIYTAVNLKSRRREIISRRENPVTTSGIEAMVEKIRLSSVAGAGRLQADRPFGDKAAIENCREMLDTVFKEILPQYGYNVRKEQLSLAHHILDAISRRCISLAEAEVGTGKTLAYLIAAIIAKRGRINGYWNMSFYTGTPYVEMAHMPIVIATSSIALQRAIVKDVIPVLSDMLLEHGIIKAPLTVALRKGREHYVCERNLRAHIPFEHNKEIKEILEGLTEPYAPIDLAEIDAGTSGAGLTAHVKRKISVPDRCDKNCPYRDDCMYLRFREQARASDIDIQVCNHNYLLADTLRRAEDKRPLIPNYQSVIIDEAHKFLSAARSMYGLELSCAALLDIADSVNALNFKRGAKQTEILCAAEKLSKTSARLFRKLEEASVHEDTEDESDRFPAVIDDNNHRLIRSIRKIADELFELVAVEPIVGNGAGRKAQLLWELEEVCNQAAAFVCHDDYICWIETDNQDCQLCAIPKDLEKRLYDDLWSKGIPTILTSGTLSAAGDFSHIKKTLGIERVSKYRLTETSKPSPFNYKENALIYISEDMPFPDQRNPEYILALANEIEQLIYASHGHAAVLFTSYKVMDMVWEHLEERGIPFPMFRLNKGGVREIERFKNSGNGVLFAAGALWEGIDIPGDALSMLIMAKLPFPVPDPISEYEQTLYKDFGEYKEQAIIPETFIKTKQGNGRGIRIESDTCVFACLDCRVSRKGGHRAIYLDSLPCCPVTDSLAAVEDFYEEKKSPEYFE
jgi:ATP-dependent DNA helicase DinG